MTIPTYRQRLAPAGLMTRRQLRAAGLRPGGHDPVAQLRYWRHGWQLAFLYDAHLARPHPPDDSRPPANARSDDARPPDLPGLPHRPPVLHPPLARLLPALSGRRELSFWTFGTYPSRARA